VRLVFKPCVDCLEHGEGRRIPLDPASPLVGYVLRCPSCGWRTLIRSADERGGRVSMEAYCDRCDWTLTMVNSPIPGAGSCADD